MVGIKVLVLLLLCSIYTSPFVINHTSLFLLIKQSTFKMRKEKKKTQTCDILQLMEHKVEDYEWDRAFLFVMEHCWSISTRSYRLLFTMMHLCSNLSMRILMHVELDLQQCKPTQLPSPQRETNTRNNLESHFYTKKIWWVINHILQVLKCYWRNLQCQDIDYK